MRESLLNAGLTHFHGRGFNAVGIKEITDTAGVPKGSFYNYFSSKNAFAAEVLERYWADIAQSHGHLLGDESVPPARRISMFFEALTRDHAERGFALGCLIGNLALELSDDHQEARSRLAAVLNKWTDLLSSCLAEGHDDHVITVSPDTELASLIIESWEGAVMRGRIDRSKVPYDRFLTASLPRLIGIGEASASTARR